MQYEEPTWESISLDLGISPLSSSAEDSGAQD